MTDEIKDKSLIPKQDTSLDKPSEELDFDLATTILRSLASTSEENITLDNLHPVPFSQEITKKALSFYAQHLTTGTPDKWYRLIDKNTPNGKLQLFVAYDDEGNRSDPDKIGIQLISDSAVVLDSRFRPSDQKYVSDKTWIAFKDARVNKDIDQISLEKGMNLDEYKFLWRGIRWMSANFLHWNEGGMIMPEDLDRPQLPPQSS